MIRPLMALACLAGIVYLFRRDIERRGSDTISWAPLVWMFIAGSRYVSSWLQLSGPMASADAYAEGSPVDRLVFLTLAVWGATVLYRRDLPWRRILWQNGLLVLYYAYCLSSIGWSDDPFVLLKRWVKDLGNPIMALVMLTERRPYEAVGVTLRRLAFLLLPLSMLFVRYYPELGRAYKASGAPMYTGVGHQKNDLGLMCLISGIYFAWKWLQNRAKAANAEPLDRVDLLLIVTLVWLLRMSDSQTSILTLIVVTLIFAISRVRFLARRPSWMVPVVVLSGLAYYVLLQTMQIDTLILGVLGRDASLTNRVQLWDVVTAHQPNVLLGAGFMSFWAGERMEAIWSVLGVGINQAHNGYLEQYLNLGYVGVVALFLVMATALVNVWGVLRQSSSAGMLRLALVVAAVLYNYTEAAFYGINNMWVLLLVGVIVIDGHVEDTAPEPAPLAARPRFHQGRWGRLAPAEPVQARDRRIAGSRRVAASRGLVVGCDDGRPLMPGPRA